MIPQRGCKITPTNPLSLEPSGGILRSGMDNATINCSCYKRNGPVAWFSPNGDRLSDFHNTLEGSPYVTQDDEGMSSVAVIPTFNYTMFGVYTCGIGPSYPPSHMAITNLSKSACMCYQFSSSEEVIDTDGHLFYRT